jgi:ribosome-binding protein aMBF1 (putative translation factor)
MSHQDFRVLDIGNRVHKKPSTPQHSHERTIQSKLNHTNMGDEDFDNTHATLEKKFTQFRQKCIRARQHLNCNQQEFANRLQVNKSIIQEIESGKRKVEPYLIQRLNPRLSQMLDM